MLDGLTTAVSENTHLSSIARRTVLSDDALSILIPIFEEIFRWDTAQIWVRFLRSVARPSAVSDDGLFLSDPDALLDEWRDAYEPPAGKRLGFTTLHGSAFGEAVRNMSRAQPSTGLMALASFSAAQWLAPYGRTGTQYFYADDAGLEQVQSALKLSLVSKGENVVVTLLQDSGLFRDTVEPAPGVICTSPVQTYLDLAAAGERGREAADHLRQDRLTWQK